MKSKEEILLGKPKKQGKHIGQLPHYHQNVVLSAMQEYAEAYHEEKMKERNNDSCSHGNTEHQNLRCNVCLDCGNILETDI